MGPDGQSLLQRVEEAYACLLYFCNRCMDTCQALVVIDFTGQRAFNKDFFGWPLLRVNIVLVLMRDVVVVGEAVGLPVDVLLEAKHAF